MRCRKGIFTSGIIVCATVFGVSLPGRGSQHNAQATPAPWQADFTNQHVFVDAGDGRKASVTFVKVNLSDKHILVEPVLAGEHFGAAAPLSTLAQKSGAILAINGTFFNSYSNGWPQGTLRLQGMFDHLDGATWLTVGTEGGVNIVRAKAALILGLHHSWSWPDVLYPSTINEVTPSPKAITILTPEFGDHTKLGDRVCVVVRNGDVTSIHRGVTSIPKDGFVVEFGMSTYNQTALKSIHLGDAIAYRINVTQSTGTPLDFSQVRSVLGGGPMLVDHGHIVLNAEQEGFVEPKILAGGGQRSFVGIDATGRLVMGTVADATLTELAHVALGLHLQEAMNLDGGASSGLYYVGNYLTKPGRKLADALVVSYVNQRPTEPSKDTWDTAELTLMTQARQASATGQASQAEKLYQKVLQIDPSSVDAALSLAKIYAGESDSTNAILWFRKTIELDPYQSDARNRLGWILYSGRRYEDAIGVFSDWAKFDGTNPDPYYGLGECYASYTLKEYDLARKYLNQAVSLDPNGPVGKQAASALASLPRNS